MWKIINLAKYNKQLEKKDGKRDNSYHWYNFDYPYKLLLYSTNQFKKLFIKDMT